MNLKDLAKDLQTDFHSVLKAAKKCGFDKGPNDDLDEAIISAIKSDFSPKALGASPEEAKDNLPSVDFNAENLSNASQAQQSTYENHRRATRNLAIEKARLEGQLEAIEEHQAKLLSKAQTKAELNREEQIKLLSENSAMIADFKSHSENYRGETLNVYATGEIANKDLEQQIASIKSFAKQSRYWQN